MYENQNIRSPSELLKYDSSNVLVDSMFEENWLRLVIKQATGTGKTTTSAAIIKMFLRLYNVKRVLFLVDRLELETQAQKEINYILSNDYTTTIWKEKRND